jgi:hypothetical protein
VAWLSPQERAPLSPNNYYHQHHYNNNNYYHQTSGTQAQHSLFALFEKIGGSGTILFPLNELPLELYLLLKNGNSDSSERQSIRIAKF